MLKEPHSQGLSTRPTGCGRTSGGKGPEERGYLAEALDGQKHRVEVRPDHLSRRLGVAARLLACPRRAPRLRPARARGAARLRHPARAHHGGEDGCYNDDVEYYGELAGTGEHPRRSPVRSGSVPQAIRTLTDSACKDGRSPAKSAASASASDKAEARAACESAFPVREKEHGA